MGYMTDAVSDVLLKRFTLLKRMEYFIEESVYYRTHSDSIVESRKKILLNSSKEIGQIKIA